MGRPAVGAFEAYPVKRRRFGRRALAGIGARSLARSQRRRWDRAQIEAALLDRTDLGGRDGQRPKFS
jgi:hypothetical protein